MCVGGRAQPAGVVEVGAGALVGAGPAGAVVDGAPVDDAVLGALDDFAGDELDDEEVGRAAFVTAAEVAVEQSGGVVGDVAPVGGTTVEQSDAKSHLYVTVNTEFGLDPKVPLYGVNVTDPPAGTQTATPAPAHVAVQTAPVELHSPLAPTVVMPTLNPVMTMMRLFGVGFDAVTGT